MCYVMCVQAVLIASMPVFVNSSVPGPDPDPAWNVPKSRGGCTVPACYNATTKRKWFGTVSYRHYGAL